MGIFFQYKSFMLIHTFNYKLVQVWQMYILPESENALSDVRKCLRYA